MTQSEFKQVGQSDQRLFGPRKILVCGYTPKEQTLLCTALESTPEFIDLPIIFARQEDGDTPLGTLFTFDHRAGQESTSTYPRVIIMAGLKEQELHRCMGEYKKAPLESPIWATLTPTSATWNLNNLLKELGREHEAMHKKR